MTLPSGHKVEKLEGEELEEQRRDFGGYDYDMIRLHPDKWVLPMPFVKFSSDIYNFKVSFILIFVQCYFKCFLLKLERHDCNLTLLLFFMLCLMINL